jgi:hypothetical protein
MYPSGDQNKSTRGGLGKCIQGFDVGDLKKRRRRPSFRWEGNIKMDVKEIG